METNNKKNRKKYLILTLLLLLLMGAVSINGFMNRESAPAAADKEPTLVASLEEGLVPLAEAPATVAETPQVAPAAKKTPVAATLDIKDSEMPLAPAPAVENTIVEEDVPLADIDAVISPTVPEIPATGGGTVIPEEPAIPEEPTPEPPAPSMSNVEKTYSLAAELFPSPMTWNDIKAITGTSGNNDGMRPYMLSTMGGTLLPLDADVYEDIYSEKIKGQDLYIHPYFAIADTGEITVVLYAKQESDFSSQSKWTTNLIYVDGQWYEYYSLHNYNGSETETDLAGLNFTKKTQAEIIATIENNPCFKTLGESFDIVEEVTPVAINLMLEFTTESAIIADDEIKATDAAIIGPEIDIDMAVDNEEEDQAFENDVEQAPPVKSDDESVDSNDGDNNNVDDNDLENDDNQLPSAPDDAEIK